MYGLSPWLHGWFGVSAAMLWWAGGMCWLAGAHPPGWAWVAAAVAAAPLWPAWRAWPEAWDAPLAALWVVALPWLVAAGGALAQRKAWLASFLAGWAAISVVWCVLAWVVWLGWTDGEGVHLGRWMLVVDASGKPTGPFVNGNVFGVCAGTGAVAAY
ncbi:MAG: hypothetical protein D6771_09460, partial [Zetaproteobacteria bacterium]